MSEQIQLDVAPEDWSTFDTSLILESGYILWFYNNSELGADVRFSVVGNGSTEIADLDKVIPQPTSRETTYNLPPYRLDPNILGFKASDDDIDLALTWCGTPKQDASSLSASIPTSGVKFYCNGVTTTLTTFSINDSNIINFRITSTDAFLDFDGSREIRIDSLGAGSLTLS